MSSADFNDIEFGDKSEGNVVPRVPHIQKITSSLNNFIIRMKGSTGNVDLKMRICKEYKDFYLSFIELTKHKYSFFKLNPLYDFFKFGFLEIFKPKKWNLRLRVDFSQLTEDERQLDQLLEFLIANFKKLDN